MKYTITLLVLLVVLSSVNGSHVSVDVEINVPKAHHDSNTNHHTKHHQGQPIDELKVFFEDNWSKGPEDPEEAALISTADIDMAFDPIDSCKRSRSTPYMTTDQKELSLKSMHGVLDEKYPSPAKAPTMADINKIVNQIKGIRYGFNPEQPILMPNQFWAQHFGDCKAKSLALYQKMNQLGATNFAFIVGKRTASQRVSHAWIEWDYEGTVYILDATWFTRALPRTASDVKSYAYLYAYEHDNQYTCHTA